MIVVVPCSGSKYLGRHQAAELYAGPYFKMTLAAALALVPRSHVYILSAKHGLLTLEQEVDFYEQRLDRPGAITVDEIRLQASTFGILESDVVILASSLYSRILLRVWPKAFTPLAGLAGIGYHRRFLSTTIKTGTLP